MSLVLRVYTEWYKKSEGKQIFGLYFFGITVYLENCVPDILSGYVNH